MALHARALAKEKKRKTKEDSKLSKQKKRHKPIQTYRIAYKRTENRIFIHNHCSTTTKSFNQSNIVLFY